MAIVITQTATGGVASSGGVVNTGSISIGTAAADRYIVLCCTSETVSASQTSATLDYGSGDTAMTAGAQANFGSVFARVFYLAVPTGTTGTFKITYGAAVTNVQNQHTVYSVTGADHFNASGSGTSTDMDASSPLTTVISSTFVGGITFDGFIGVASCGTGSTTLKTWANATKDQELSVGGNYCHTTATTTTPLVNASVTCTGSTNGEDGALAYITFEDSAAAFGSLIGSSSNQSGSITTPFSPTTSVTVVVGDLVVVVIGEAGALTATTCSDNLGNTYTALTSGTNSASNVKAYYSLVTVAGLSTPAVVCTSSNDDGAINVAVYKGLFTSSPLDQNPAILGDATVPYTSNLSGTLSQADELVVGYFGSSASEIYNAASPGTVDAATTAGAQATGLTHTVVAATTSLTMSISGTTGARSTVCGVATFKKGSTETITEDKWHFPWFEIVRYRTQVISYCLIGFLLRIAGH